MSMYVKRFLAKEFSYLLENENTNDTTVLEVGDDDDDETQLTD
jgi:hypothetical protein